MIVKALFKKALPARTGQGKNGEYDFRPFIIEFDQETAQGTSTHSMIIEISSKRAKVDELTKIVGTAREVELYIGFDVESYDGKYYNRIFTFVKDNEFKIERSY